jgi:hypothetical protein
MRAEEGHDDMFKKRFNVAASRARDQMWVVHSLDPSVDLKREGHWLLDRLHDLHFAMDTWTSR